MRTLTLVVLAAVVGCGGGGSQPDFPAVHPVTGTITKSGKPVSGGVVRFAPDPDKQEFMINSEVGPDGSFKLSTVRATDRSGERKPGAPAGKYVVTYTPMVADQTTGLMEPVVLAQPVTVEAKENKLTLELPKK